MQMSSSNKRKYLGNDDAGDGCDSSDSSALTVLLRNKLQRSDCNDVGSSYTKLMLQNMIVAAATKPACTTNTYTSTSTDPTTTNNNNNNKDTQKYRSPTTATPTFTPNYRNNHKPTGSSSKQNHATTPRNPAAAATTDVARLVQELLELCGSHNYNYNYSHSHSNTGDNTENNNNDHWKQTREKLWRMGDAAFQSDRDRDAMGGMGGCLVVTHSLKAAVKAATDMHAAAAAVDPTVLSTLLTVQEAACFCLTNLTYRHRANRNRLMAAGGASVLVAMLQGATATCSMHGADGSGGRTSKVCSQAGAVLSRACMVLDNLAASESCREAIVQADVMKAVCATMLAFPAARELQFSGCRILGRLAESCQNNNGKQQQQHVQQQHVQLRAVRANGVVAVAQAFERFCQTDAATAHMASAALQCLTATAWHDGNDPDTK